MELLKCSWKTATYLRRERIASHTSYTEVSVKSKHPAMRVDSAPLDNIQDQGYELEPLTTRRKLSCKYSAPL